MVTWKYGTTTQIGSWFNLANQWEKDHCFGKRINIKDIG